MTDCIFCNIANGKIPGKFVYQDKDFIVINDIHPRAPVHLLVFPKKHITDFMNADTTVLQLLLDLLKELIQEHHVKNYRLVTNGDGAAAIDHFHVHLLGQVAMDRDL